MLVRGSLRGRQELRTFGGGYDDGSNQPENIQERAQYDCEQLHKMTLLQFADSVGLFIALPLRQAATALHRFYWSLKTIAMSVPRRPLITTSQRLTIRVTGLG